MTEKGQTLDLPVDYKSVVVDRTYPTIFYEAKNVVAESRSKLLPAPANCSQKRRDNGWNNPNIITGQLTGLVFAHPCTVSIEH